MCMCVSVSVCVCVCVCVCECVSVCVCVHVLIPPPPSYINPCRLRPSLLMTMERILQVLRLSSVDTMNWSVTSQPLKTNWR